MQGLAYSDFIIVCDYCNVFTCLGRLLTSCCFRMGMVLCCCFCLSFLDHFGTRWLVHRPDARAFHKQGVAIGTAAGGGMRSTIKDMYHIMFFWGYPKIYRLGLAVFAAKPEHLSEKTWKKIHKKTDQLAAKIKRNQNPRTPACKTRIWFAMIRFAHKHFAKSEPDYGYWEERGWHGKNRPWK